MRICNSLDVQEKARRKEAAKEQKQDFFGSSPEGPVSCLSQVTCLVESYYVSIYRLA